MLHGSDYRAVHRLILQYVMACRIVKYSTLEEQIKKLMPGESLNLETAIFKINETINCFNQRIKICQCELTGEKVCIFLSTVDKDYDKKYKMFTDSQEEYLLHIVHSIVESGNGFLGSINALNMSSNLETPMTKLEAEENLNLFLSKGYLLNDAGRYCLSMLAISEFETYFAKNLANQIENCILCQRTALINVRCSNCNRVVHRHCFLKYNEISKGKNQSCPGCKKQWSEI